MAPAHGHWSSAYEIDPFSVGLEEKLALLFAAEEALRGDPRLVRTEAGARAWRERKAFASTEGAACTQEQVACGAGIAAYAVGRRRRAGALLSPARTAASSRPRAGSTSIGSTSPARAPRVASEAVELLTAPPCPRGARTIVLHGEQLALQVHESIGHALELDRMLGSARPSYAGTSWVRAGATRAGLRYGSEHLNITADATLPGGAGLVRLGRRGRRRRARTPLVARGVLRGALSDRESAAALGLEPPAAACAPTASPASRSCG